MNFNTNDYIRRLLEQDRYSMVAAYKRTHVEPVLRAILALVLLVSLGQLIFHVVNDFSKRNKSINETVLPPRQQGGKQRNRDNYRRY
jgi:hypothetical protein